MSEPVSSPNSSPPAPIPENPSPSPWPVPSPYSSPPAPPAPAIPPPPNISEAGGVSTGLVVGSVLGGLVVIVVLSSLFVFWWCKRKKTRDDEAPPPPAPKVDSYGGRQNDPPPASHVTQPPKPSPHPPLASHPPQSQVHKSSPSLSQPRFTSSSGGSGSTYSGSDVSLPPPSPGIALGFLKTIFTYEELARATDGFSDAKLLGQGGFGYVHKGVLPNGKEVAVKQLKAESRQGEREFRAEIEIISRIHHRHLVSLLGYSISGLHRLLVYEFVPNNTLEFHLHGKGRPTMDWPTRLKIALGSAKGFAYLHEDCHPKIIHRDIKAANILLDFKLDAKVADFGLAKFFPDDNTHVSTRVMGTFGYMAPEYASIGKLTEKSDVFSFGVMLLELVTGRQPIISTDASMEESLAAWARPLLYRAIEYGNLDALVDPKLQNEYNHNEMTRMVACAAACVRHSAHRRPRMSHLVRALEGDVSLSALNEGISSGQSSGYDSKENSDYYIMPYNEDFRKMALNSQESRASGYGLNPSGSSSEDQNTREMEAKKMKKHS